MKLNPIILQKKTENSYLSTVKAKRMVQKLNKSYSDVKMVRAYTIQIIQFISENF